MGIDNKLGTVSGSVSNVRSVSHSVLIVGTEPVTAVTCLQNAMIVLIMIGDTCY